MTEIRIDRLTLQAGALSKGDARRLARLVGDAVSRWSLSSGTAVRADQLQVSVAARPGDSVEQIAVSVAAAIESAVRQAGES
ncbi:hypothetical protein [Mycobacterium sp.]|uniref:hypothetical protein n=1 Tax=Mycobacterium sp. TaxID=1785 RepID=UPI003D0B8032